jgi:hypothetical protein
MAVALVFAMKLRDSNIHLDDDLEDFMTNIQPPITEENYSEILRRSERNTGELTDSSQSNDEDDEDENESDNDEAILATLSDETDNEDDNDEEEDNELDSTIRGKSRQVNRYLFIIIKKLIFFFRGKKSGEIVMVKVVYI